MRLGKPMAAGPRDLGDPVDRVGHGGLGYRCGDVLGGDRLEVGSGNSDRVAIGGGVGDGSQELEELCGPNDGVGLTGRFDELLLGDFGPQVSAVGKPVGTDDG